MKAKRGPRIQLRMPAETVKRLRKVAKLAEVTVDQVIAVYLATEILRHPKRKVA